VDVVQKEVNLNDKMRVCLISSPSNGVIKTEENNFLSQDPQDWHYGDGQEINKLFKIKIFLFFSSSLSSLL